MNILYEDNHLIVCVKAPGILSQAGSLDLPDMLTEIKAYIKEKYNKPGNVYLGLVHRLDLNVGGVMVFAKTSKAAKRLNEQIRNRDIKKQYLAIVLGELKQNQIHHLENYIIKDNQEKKAIITDKKNGKLAKLSFKVIDLLTIDNQTYSLIDIELETGRFHQIRVQLAHINHPLYGDNKYGPKTKGYDLGLYAYSLSFIHPTKKEALTFKHYPKDGVFNLFQNSIKEIKI